MKGSRKANMIVFLIIATIAFTISSIFASLTIPNNTDSYKLISIEEDSFEPAYINKVPTIQSKNFTNNTNSTHKNITYDTNKTIEKINNTNNKNVED